MEENQIEIYLPVVNNGWAKSESKKNVPQDFIVE